MDRVLSPEERERRRREAQKVKAYQKDVQGVELNDDVLAECVDRFGTAEAIILAMVTNALPSDLAEEMQEWKESHVRRKDEAVVVPKPRRAMTTTPTKAHRNNPNTPPSKHSGSRRSQQTPPKVSEEMLTSEFKLYVGHIEDTSLDEQAIKTILEKTMGVAVHMVETPGAKENGAKNLKYCFATFTTKADAARAVQMSEHLQNKGSAPEKPMALPKNGSSDTVTGGRKSFAGKYWTFRFAQIRPGDRNKEELFRRTETARHMTTSELQAKELDPPGRVDIGETVHWRLKLTNASNDKLSLKKLTATPRRWEFDVKPERRSQIVIDAQSSAYLQLKFGPAKRYGIFRSLLVLEFEMPNARGGLPVKKTAFPEISVDVAPDPAVGGAFLDDDEDAAKRGHDGQGVWDGKARTVVATVPPEVRRGLGLHIHTPEDVNWQRKLPLYEIPDDIQAKVDETGRASGFCPWLKRDDDHFKKRLHALLWTEEAQLIKNFRKFDIAAATFEPDFGNPKKILHRLEVPGLAERRPSLLRGDLVYAWQPDTVDVEYEGWIAQVEQSTILVAFADIFHDHYQRHLHNEREKFIHSQSVEEEPPDDENDDKKEEDVQIPRAGFHVRFTFPRIEHRRMHLAVDNVALDLLWPQEQYPMTVADPEMVITWYDAKIPNCQAQSAAVREIVGLGTAADRFLIKKDSSEAAEKGPKAGGRGSEFLPAMLQSATMTKTAKRKQRVATKRPPPFLLSGAFGTGKTRTMLEAVWQTLQSDADSRILLCSETNSAADLIVEKLAEVLEPKDMLRLVHSHRNILSVPMVSRKYSPYDHSKSIFLTPDLHQILSYRVVVSTMMNAATLFGIGVPVDHYTHIFLEEAANALLPVALLPLTMACPSTVIVLVGDEKQVSPRVSSQSARHHGLEESLLTWFARLRDDVTTKEIGATSVLKVELVENFRSHPLLLSLPSELFYGNRLISKAQGYPSNCLENWKRLPKPGSPFLVIGVEGHEEQLPSSPSFFNKFEAAEVVRLIEELLRDYQKGANPMSQDDVAVVTAFHLQTIHIRSLLRRKHLHRVNVGGIQVLQGQEKKAVFVTTVRSRRQWVQYDKRHKLGFLFDEKKLNTALTRSIGLLCIVGDPYVLMEEPKWRDCLEKADAIGCYEGIPLNDEEYIKERTRQEIDLNASDNVRIDDEGFLTRFANAENEDALTIPIPAPTGLDDKTLKPAAATTPNHQAPVPPPVVVAPQPQQQPPQPQDADAATEAVPRASVSDTSPPGMPSARRTPSPIVEKTTEPRPLVPGKNFYPFEPPKTEDPPQEVSIVPIRVLQWASTAFAIKGNPVPAFRSFVSQNQFLVVQVCTFGWQAHVEKHTPREGHHTVVLTRLPDDENLLLDPAIGRGSIAARATLVLASRYTPDVRPAPDVLEVRFYPPPPQFPAMQQQPQQHHPQQINQRSHHQQRQPPPQHPGPQHIMTLHPAASVGSMPPNLNPPPPPYPHPVPHPPGPVAHFFPGGQPHPLPGPLWR